MDIASDVDIVKEIRWRPVETDPSDIHLPVVFCTRKGKIGVLKNTLANVTGNPIPTSNWEWLAEKYNIEYWTYSDEIKP